MDADAHLRAGDPERNSALDRLGIYFTDGYLDVQEFDERTRKAATAQTRGELAQLFVDLPVVPGVAASSELVAEAGAQGELDEVVRRNRRVQAIDGVIWSVTMIMFFLGLFVLNWSFFWVVFPLAAFASWGCARCFVSIRRTRRSPRSWRRRRRRNAPTGSATRRTSARSWDAKTSGRYAGTASMRLRIRRPGTRLADGAPRASRRRERHPRRSRPHSCAGQPLRR